MTVSTEWTDKHIARMGLKVWDLPTVVLVAADAVGEDQGKALIDAVATLISGQRELIGERNAVRDELVKVADEAFETAKVLNDKTARLCQLHTEHTRAAESLAHLEDVVSNTLSRARRNGPEAGIEYLRTRTVR